MSHKKQTWGSAGEEFPDRHSVRPVRIKEDEELEQETDKPKDVYSVVVARWAKQAERKVEF